MSNIDDDETRKKSEDEALEVKSLRRIIGAYLNYPEAAEEDLRRHERSFRRLSPAHKALLSHLPSKFRKIRRAISKNSFFVFEMVKAFEPPLDMSRNIDSCKQHPENVSDNTRHRSRNSHLISGKDKIENINKSNESGGNEGGDSSNKDKLYSNNAFNGNVSSPSPDWLDSSFELNVPLVDIDKVRCIIRNIVRDWATEGKTERDQCYKPILLELDGLFPNRFKESPPCCLVPGAGLGRLALEISCLGFISQGNEFSYFMMICSSFILNHAETAEEWSIHPWIHSSCNSLSDSDQLRAVLVPDIHPASAGITEGFSMCGGDFVEVYNDPIHIGAWDAVVTCFFLDTAHNIVEYIEIISKIIKEEGVWINLGPLLYHFADSYDHEDEISIELSLEDVKRAALQFGFELENERTIETTYTTNPRSMMQNHYYAAFWTMRKKKQSSTDV